MAFPGNGQQIQIHAVVHSVLFVVAMGLHTLFQMLPLFFIGCGIDAQTLCDVADRLQLLVHHAIEENRAGAVRRTVEGARIVVHADGGIVMPVVQAVFMAEISAVAIHEPQKIIKIGRKPAGILAAVLDQKCRVLGKARLVHIVFALGVMQTSRKNGSGCDLQGNPSHVIDMLQKIDDTPPLIGGNVFFRKLAQCHIGQPAIPIP